MNIRNTLLTFLLLTALLFVGCKGQASQGNVENAQEQSDEERFPKPKVKIIAKTDGEAEVANTLASYADYHIEKTNSYREGDYDWGYLDTIFTKRLLDAYNEDIDKGIGITIDPIMGINDIGTRHLMAVETISQKGDTATAFMTFGDLKEDSVAVHKRKVCMAKDKGRWLIDHFIPD